MYLIRKLNIEKIGGGGQRVHASNSEKESNRNIGLILKQINQRF